MDTSSNSLSIPKPRRSRAKQDRLVSNIIRELTDSIAINPELSACITRMTNKSQDEFMNDVNRDNIDRALDDLLSSKTKKVKETVVKAQKERRPRIVNVPDNVSYSYAVVAPVLPIVEVQHDIQFHPPCNVCGSDVTPTQGRVITKCRDKCRVECHSACWRITDKCLVCEKDLVKVLRYNDGKLIESRTFQREVVTTSVVTTESEQNKGEVPVEDVPTVEDVEIRETPPRYEPTEEEVVMYNTSYSLIVDDVPTPKLVDDSERKKLMTELEKKRVIADRIDRSREQHKKNRLAPTIGDFVITTSKRKKRKVVQPPPQQDQVLSPSQPLSSLSQVVSYHILQPQPRVYPSSLQPQLDPSAKVFIPSGSYRM